MIGGGVFLFVGGRSQKFPVLGIHQHHVAGGNQNKGIRGEEGRSHRGCVSAMMLGLQPKSKRLIPRDSPNLQRASAAYSRNIKDSVLTSWIGSDALQRLTAPAAVLR